MLFNSIQFLLFVTIILALYYAVSARYRWIVLLISSYYFYMSWEPKYGLLLLASTFIDYSCAMLMQKKGLNQYRKAFLMISVVANLGLLFTFKYFDFFVEEFAKFGLLHNRNYLKWVLPVGISFYTFQTMAYSIDVYRGKVKAEQNFFRFALFISFFPQLMAGPIERAGNLLAELRKKSELNYEQFRNGVFLVLWGLYKKMVVADRIAIITDFAFQNHNWVKGPMNLVSIILLMVQVYCDFSGYTDIARGIAKMFGIRLMKNFNNPFLAKSIAEFWSRWHISLSTWFRDYVYIPLGGNKVSNSRWVFNILIVFVLSGFWHGASEGKLFWGLLHGLLFLFSSFLISQRIFKPTIFQIVVNNLLLFITFIFFPFDTVQECLSFFLAGFEITNAFYDYLQHPIQAVTLVLSILFLFSIEFFNEKTNVLSKFLKLPFSFKTMATIGFALLLIFLANPRPSPFIYFRF